MGAIVFDIDRFKTINDQCGHDAGDIILQFVAAKAKECIRNTDFLARYGGDEFVILLPNARLSIVKKLAERVRTHVHHSGINVKGRLLRPTISLGVAFSTDVEDLPSLIREADQALYEAKYAGRNLVCSH